MIEKTCLNATRVFLQLSVTPWNSVVEKENLPRMDTEIHGKYFTQVKRFNVQGSRLKCSNWFRAIGLRANRVDYLVSPKG